MTVISLNLKSIFPMTEAKFLELCQKNPEYKLELTANQELVIMSPTGGSTGNRNIKLLARLEIWTEKERSPQGSATRAGIAFDSSTMFKLPNGALRSPDAAWLTLERWNSLTQGQKDSFPPICPDFVVELRSPSDSLVGLQQKMREYVDNGVRLGWLIDPQNQRVEISRQGGEIEILTNPTQLSGENILSGFVLDLQGIMN